LAFPNCIRDSIEAIRVYDRTVIVGLVDIGSFRKAAMLFAKVAVIREARQRCAIVASRFAIVFDMDMKKIKHVGCSVMGLLGLASPR
jgi:hypothetical protein